MAEQRLVPSDDSNQCDIFNRDETEMFYKMTLDSTLKFKGENCGHYLRSELQSLFI